jgi:hypothetical protein
MGNPDTTVWAWDTPKARDHIMAISCGKVSFTREHERGAFGNMIKISKESLTILFKHILPTNQIFLLPKAPLIMI